MRTTSNSPSTNAAQTVSSAGGLIEAAAGTIANVLPTGWSQETSDGYDGVASLVIMSPGDATTTFLVTEGGAGLQLDLLEDDELRHVGRTRCVGHLAWLLEARIRFGGSVFLRVA